MALKRPRNEEQYVPPTPLLYVKDDGGDSAKRVRVGDGKRNGGTHYMMTQQGGEGVWNHDTLLHAKRTAATAAIVDGQNPYVTKRLHRMLLPPSSSGRDEENFIHGIDDENDEQESSYHHHHHSNLNSTSALPPQSWLMDSSSSPMMYGPHPQTRILSDWTPTHELPVVVWRGDKNDNYVPPRNTHPMLLLEDRREIWTEQDNVEMSIPSSSPPQLEPIPSPEPPSSRCTINLISSFDPNNPNDMEVEL